MNSGESQHTAQQDEQICFARPQTAKINVDEHGEETRLKRGLIIGFLENIVKPLGFSKYDKNCIEGCLLGSFVVRLMCWCWRILFAGA